ncbi:MAG: hypothetical protein Q9162_004108 [Coniocarpon cinnabarinum]
MASVSRNLTPVSTPPSSTNPAKAVNRASPRSNHQPFNASAASPSPLKDAKQTPPPSFQVPILTGAGAMAEQQRATERASKSPHASMTTPNPAASAAKSLMAGPEQLVSKTSDGPSATPVVNGDHRSTPITDEPMQIDSQTRRNSTRPIPDSVTDPRLTALETNDSSMLSVPAEQGEDQGRSNKAFSYPPRADQIDGSDIAGRSMTLPGPGGCAVRRGSGGEEDLDGEDGMDGIEYEENDGEQVAKRRKSEQHLHSRKRSLGAIAEASNTRQVSMTYPGPGIAPMGNHAQPPPQIQLQQPPHPMHTHLSPRMTGSQFGSQASAAQSVFSQAGGMTESPKPLSPGQEATRRLSAALPVSGRGRSPSLQQSQMSRSSALNSPGSTTLSGPVGSQTHLPSLSSIASDRGPPSSIGSSAVGHSNSHPKPTRPPPIISTAQAFNPPGPPSANSTNPPSATSQHRSSGGSLREIVNPMGNDDYMLKTEHETQMRKMQDEMRQRESSLLSRLRQLEGENLALKARDGRGSYPSVDGVAATPTQ